MTDPGGSLHTYKVGDLYNPRVTTWPEQAELSVSPDGVQLGLFYAAPTAAEVRAAREGAASFALLPAERQLFLLYRFHPGIPWSDTPWEARRQLPARPVGVPGGSDLQGQHLLVHVVLVDAGTGVLRAQRGLTWPPEFADAFRAAVYRDLDRADELDDAAREQEEMYQRYTSTEAMLQAATARC